MSINFAFFFFEWVCVIFNAFIDAIRCFFWKNINLFSRKNFGRYFDLDNFFEKIYIVLYRYVENYWKEIKLIFI